MNHFPACFPKLFRNIRNQFFFPSEGTEYRDIPQGSGKHKNIAEGQIFYFGG